MNSFIIGIHYASLLLFISALFVSVHNIIPSYRYPRIGKWVALHSLSVSILCILFLILQLDWIWSGHNESVGDTTSLLWLSFDIALGVSLLCYATAIGLMIKWKRSCDWCSTTTLNPPCCKVKRDIGKSIHANPVRSYCDLSTKKEYKGDGHG